MRKLLFIICFFSNVCFSPGHNRSMAEEYTTATETESVISSRHSGKICFYSFLFSCQFCPVASHFCYLLLFPMFFMFCHEERHILPRSGRVHRETYEKYDRFDGELACMLFVCCFRRFYV